MSPHSDTARGRITYELSEKHVDQLVDLYRNEWWTQERTRTDVAAILAGSDVTIGILEGPTDELVGFVRIVTDFITWGLILDVITRQDRRGYGYGDLLMDFLINDPNLSQIRVLTLRCREPKIGFYERYGFKVEVETAAIAGHEDQGTGAHMQLIRNVDA